MANLDFYAVKGDKRDLLSFIFSETDILIYELSSEHNQEPRCFRTTQELEAVHSLGQHDGPLLQLWSPTVIGPPTPRRIEMVALPDRPFRYAVEGVGLMQLYLGGEQATAILHSHFGHWNEAGARKAEGDSADECNWGALSKVSGSIQRFIQRRSGVAKLHSRPILKYAFEAVQHDSVLKFGAQVYHCSSEHIVAKSPNLAFKRDALKRAP